MKVSSGKRNNFCFISQDSKFEYQPRQAILTMISNCFYYSLLSNQCIPLTFHAHSLFHPHGFAFNDYSIFRISMHRLCSLKIIYMCFLGAFETLLSAYYALQYIHIFEMLLIVLTRILCKGRRDRFLPVTCALYFQKVCRHQFSKDLTKTIRKNKCVLSDFT